MNWRSWKGEGLEEGRGGEWSWSLVV